MSLKSFLKLGRGFRNNSGAAAVEFALLMIPLLGILMVSVQVTIVFLFDEELQSVTQKAARQLMTGSAQTAKLTQDQFKQQVCALAPTPFTCANLMIDVQSGSSFSALSTGSLTPTYNAQGIATNTWSYSPGNPGDIVIMRVMYSWPVFGGTLAPGLANQANGTHLMVGTAVFKNEPYSS
jgi:Flp pilus assembly protein TadG